MDMQEAIAAPENIDPAQHLVAFRLAERNLALPAACVEQIVPMLAITPAPQAHEALVGMINVHGAWTPVIDLRRYLELAALAPKLQTPILLMRFEGHLLGLIVDEVLDVISVPAEQITSLAPLLPEGIRQVTGPAKLANGQGKTLFVLEVEDLFRYRQGEALAQAVRALFSEQNL